MEIQDSINKINNLLMEIDVELAVFELFKDKEITTIVGNIRENNFKNFKVLENKLNNIT